MTEFMTGVEQALTKKGLSPSSISLYIKNLKGLNGALNFDNFNFLKKPTVVTEYLEKFKPSTRKSYLGMIVSVLGLYPDSKSYTTLKNKYYILFKGESDAVRETAGQKTETQTANWIEWKDVMKIWEEKHREILAITIPPKKKGAIKPLTDAEYTKLLHFTVLSLYTLTPPRRNADYLNMYLVLNGDVKELDKTKNYLDLPNKEFVFNTGKTSKHYPNHHEAIPAELFAVIELYLKYYPKQPIENLSPFLVFADGGKLSEINVITRILNKMFKKNIGVSMLRHSYITSKYKDVNAERNKDAEAMSHSLNQQTAYVLQ